METPSLGLDSRMRGQSVSLELKPIRVEDYRKLQNELWQLLRLVGDPKMGRFQKQRSHSITRFLPFACFSKEPRMFRRGERRIS